MTGLGDMHKAIPSALEKIDEIRHSLAGKELALFLDYDGTLSPIMPRPDLAVLSDAMRDTLNRLGHHCTLAIVSGRTRADVHKLVAVEDIYFAGNHGLEIEGPHQSEIKYEIGQEFIQAVDQIYSLIKDQLQSIEGVLIEHKTFSLSVHFRLVAARDVSIIESVIDSALGKFPNLRKHHGKKVFEVRPNLDWDKGKAVLWLLDALQLDHAGVLPLYIGDDVTDEDAFRALTGRGIGILVSSKQRETAAEYILQDTNEVQRFLDRLERILTEGRK